MQRPGPGFSPGPDSIDHPSDQFVFNSTWFSEAEKDEE